MCVLSRPPLLEQSCQRRAGTAITMLTIPGFPFPHFPCPFLFFFSFSGQPRRPTSISFTGGRGHGRGCDVSRWAAGAEVWIRCPRHASSVTPAQSGPERGSGGESWSARPVHAADVAPPKQGILVFYVPPAQWMEDTLPGRIMGT